MLNQLFHNRAVLFANGPKGSYRKALNSPNRWKFYNHLNVAFKFALAAGIIRNKYFELEGRSLNFKVNDNLIKVEKVALALEELRQAGVITAIRNGCIYYPRQHKDFEGNLTGKEVLEIIFSRLQKIRGYGAIDVEAARERLNKKDIRKMFVSDDALKTGFQMVDAWGLYGHLLNAKSKNMAAGRELFLHKKDDAKKLSSELPQNRLDLYRTMVEAEAREKDIDDIKTELEADNPEEIPPFKPPGGGVLPKYAFVISDVHLREFKHENTEDILRFLWMVKRLDGRLIINGDFFDVWRSGGLEKCWISNTRVVNALTKLKEVIIVAGNHDEFLEVLAKRGGIFANPNLRVVKEYISSDKRVCIFHGHQFDKYNRPGAWAGRLATKAVTRMEASAFKKLLGRLNKRTQGVFSGIADIMGSILGPHLSSFFLLIPKLVFPTAYVLRRKIENIMAFVDSEVEIATQVERLKLTERNPLTIIIGHLHYEGISYLTEKLRAAVKEKYGDKVKLVITDSWEGGQGYAGDYVSITDVDSYLRAEGDTLHLTEEREFLNPYYKMPDNIELDHEVGPPRLIVRKEVWRKSSDWEDIRPADIKQAA